MNMKNQKTLSVLILIVILLVCFQSSASAKPGPEELNSFTFYYSDGKKVDFDDVRTQLIQCIYPTGEPARGGYETKQEYEERKTKCACPPCNCDDVVTLKNIYFLLPVASMKYDPDHFTFKIVADLKYKMHASKERVAPLSITQAREFYNTKLPNEIKPFMVVNAPDRMDYVNRFSDGKNPWQRSYVETFTHEYFTNVILDTRHEGMGSDNETIYSISFQADSPLEKARRLKTMGNDLVFMIHGDMVYKDASGIGDLTKVRNVFYVDKIILYHSGIADPLISATP